MTCVHYCRKALFVVMLGLGMWQASPAVSAEDETLLVREAWLRAVPPVSDQTAGYMVLENRGREDVTLTAAHTEAAHHVMLHGSSQDAEHVRHMHAISEVVVPAGEQAVFSPGGDHLMVMGLVRPLEPGESITLCLTFMEREEHCVPFRVQP